MRTPPEVPNDRDQNDIDGGEIDELGDELRSDFIQVQDWTDYEFHSLEHQAKTTSRLAFTFALILAIALGVHYIVFVILAVMGLNDALTAVNDVFNVWLPALVGIVSSVATYYFTRDK